MESSCLASKRDGPAAICSMLKRCLEVAVPQAVPGWVWLTRTIGGSEEWEVGSGDVLLATVHGQRDFESLQRLGESSLWTLSLFRELDELGETFGPCQGSSAIQVRTNAVLMLREHMCRP